MSIKTETLQLKVVVDTKEGINNLAYLEEEYRKLGEARKSAASVDDEKKIIATQDKVREIIAKQRDELGLYGKTVRQIQSYIRDLSADLKDLNPFSDKAIGFRGEIEKARQVAKGGTDINPKTAEAEALRLIAKEAGTASLSLKQLETVADHMHSSMVSGAKSGNIAEHALYKEWVQVTAAIKQGKDALNAVKIAENAYQTELRETVKAQGIEATSLTHLREYHKLLQKEIQDTANIDSITSKQMIAHAQKVDSAINKKQNAVNGTGSFFSQIKNGLPAAIAGGIGGLTVGAASYVIDGITSGFSNATKRAAELSDQTASMQKSLSASEQDVQGIVKGLHGIDTRTSSKELKEIVIAAGQMGIAKEEVVAFTKSMDTLTVSLKDEFTGGGEEITKTFVPLRNIFTDIKTQKIDQDLLHIGNAVNVLGQSGLATGPVIADITARIGASAAIYGVTAGQTLGLAASYQELAISSERGSTATVKIMQRIASAPAEFAKIAGMGTKEFADLVNNDMASAFVKVAEGFAKSKGKATEFAEKLSDANISSAAISEVLAKVGQNSGLVADKMNLATTALKGTDSIMGEFNIRNENFAAKLEKAGKVWDSWMNVLSYFVQKIAEPVISLMAKMETTTQSVTEAFEQQRQKNNLLQSTIPGLKNKYIELSKEAKDNVVAQRELKQVINEIAGAVPSAITQWDLYGNALKINLGILNDVLEKSENATKKLKWDAISENNDKLKRLRRDRDQELKILNQGYYEQEVMLGKGESSTKKVILNDANIKQRTENLKRYNAEINKTANDTKSYFHEIDVTAPTPKPTGGGGNTNTNLSEKQKNAQIAREKYLQESATKEIELASKLAFDKDQALANEENKRVQQAERHAEQETKRVKTQFRDQNGLIIKESKLTAVQKQLIADEIDQIDKTLNENSLRIRQEFDQKREAQITEQTNRAIQIAQTAHAQELQAKLKTAQSNGGRLGIFNAQTEIINSNEYSQTSELTAKFEKEKITLKDNKEALKLLEENYQAQKNAIIQKGIDDRHQLLTEETRWEFENDKKNKLEKLKLDVTEAEQNGKNPKSEKLAVLNFEEQAEIASAEKTGESVENIRRKYRLLRQAQEEGSWKGIAETALGYFSQAFNGISNIFKAELQNRTQAEQEYYESSVRNIESQKDHEILTNRQAAKQKALLDKDHDKAQRKLKREAFELDKAAAMTNIIIQTALGVMKASPNVPLMIATGVTGAIELGIAASQKAPAYFDGGELPSVFANPVDNKGGGLIIAHPDEYVIPKRVRETQLFANLEPVFEHMRLTGRTYYDGGAIAGSSNPITPTFGSNKAEQDDFFKKLDARFEKFENHINRFGEVIETPINAQVNFDEETTYNLTKKQNKLNKKVSESYANTNQSLIQ